MWTYADLWSSATTWGGSLANKPTAGDSVIITLGEVIYLDEIPPQLYLLTLDGGTLIFADWIGDIALNASFIMVCDRRRARGRVRACGSVISSLCSILLSRLR